MSYNCSRINGDGSSCFGGLNDCGDCYPCDTSVGVGEECNSSPLVSDYDILKTRGVPSQGSTTTGPRGGSMEQFTEFRNMSGCGLWMCGD